MAFLSAFALVLAFQQGTTPLSDFPARYRPKPPAPAYVVARVNGVAITAADVEGVLWDWRGADAVQDLVTYQLIRTEAEKARVEVSEQEVEAAINAFMPQYQKNLKPGVTAEAALLAEGMTRSRLYLRFRTQMLIQKILERSFMPANLVRVSTLVFRFANEQVSAMTDAINKANAAYDRLKKGESWESVFNSINTDTRAAGTKGLVGWRELGVFPQIVADELSKMKAGDVTHPARTDIGIQIFRLDMAGKDAKGKDLDDLRNEFMASGQAQMVAKLHKEAKIEKLWPAPNGK